jgi:hypothetical protein
MSLYTRPGLYTHPGLYPSRFGGPVVTPPTIFPDVYHAAMASGGYAQTYTVDAVRGGVPVAGAQGLTPTGGTITDTTAPGVRRNLSLELAPEPGLFDKLAPAGTTLIVTGHIRYLSRTGQDIPMGVFDVDSQTLTEGGGRLSLSAPDKWIRIKRARFAGPAASTPGMRVTDQIVRLIQGALGSTTAVRVTATSTAKVGALTWTQDRDVAIMDLAKSIGAWVFFDRQGAPIVADIPTLGANADWTLTTGSASSTVLSMDRTRARGTTYNVVVVTSTASSGPAFPTQVVWDSDPLSPTYAGPDPINRPELAGPFGVSPYFFDTPLPLDKVSAAATGRSILSQTVGLASQVSLTTAPNMVMDAFAVLDIRPPRERYDIPRVLERHIADTVTHPLDVSQPMHIDGRSTRSDPYT